ncbi:hypothetical protein BC830DRAFT_1111820 [Chytriomyces sp. MP71]|nr:hypothetical protein BC830DRAFT_1111820 [Chytriomyces sp. MP71]
MGIRKMARDALGVSKVPTLRNELQRYGRVTSIRGGGLFDCLVAPSTHVTNDQLQQVLLQLPAKFKKVVFVKLGSFVLVELYHDSATKVHGDILGAVSAENVKELKAMGEWPAALDAPLSRSPTEPSGDDAKQESRRNMFPPSDSEDSDGDLFVNRNRMHVEEESDSEEDEGENNE